MENKKPLKENSLNDFATKERKTRKLKRESIPKDASPAEWGEAELKAMEKESAKELLSIGDEEVAMRAGKTAIRSTALKQIDYKRMDESVRKKDEENKKLIDEIQKESDEKDRIREEKELERMHREETNAEVKVLTSVAAGGVLSKIVTSDRALDDAGVRAKNDGPGLFGRIAAAFRGGESKEEIIESNAPTEELSEKDRPASLSEPAKIDRSAFTASMEKILAKSEKEHSLSATSKSKSKQKDRPEKGDSIPQR